MLGFDLFLVNVEHVVHGRDLNAVIHNPAQPDVRQLRDSLVDAEYENR
jgi:hypothetical protein